MGELFNNVSRRNSDGTNLNVITNSAEYGLIPQRDFFDKDIAVEGNTKNYYIIKSGDFVYNPRKSTTSPYGPFNCYQGKSEGIVSPLYTCLTPKSTEHTDYLLWYFKSPAWYSYIYHNGAQGGARHDRVGMTNDLMKGIPVSLPCKEEQRKVVEFLSFIDDRISLQHKLVENLKNYKRGVLTAAFESCNDSSSFETTPYYFSELATKRKEKYDPHSGKQFPCVELEHIEQETGRVIGNVQSTQQNSIKNICKAGDTLFGKLRPYLRKYTYVKEDMVCSSEIWPLVPSEKLIPEYLFYLVQTDEFLRIANISSGTKMPRAEWANIEKAVFLIPSKEKQSQIVQLLRNLDRRILDKVAMLENIQMMKKGLLQQLFI